MTRFSVFFAFALAACQGEAEAKTRAEAEAVVHAVRDVREAENADKSQRLEGLRGARCSAEDVCALKQECLSAYELYVRGLESVAKVRRALANDAGLQEATDSAKLLETAQKDVEKGKELAEGCARKEAQISVRYKLR